MNLNNFIGKDSPGKMGHKNHPLQTGWYSVVQQAFSCIIKLTQQLACSATSLMLLMLRSGTGFRPARNAELGIIMEWYLLYINRLQTVDCSCLKPANSYLGSVWCPLSMGELRPVEWAGPPSCVQEYTRISCEGTPPYHLSSPWAAPAEFCDSYPLLACEKGQHQLQEKLGSYSTWQGKDCKALRWLPFLLFSCTLFIQ